jgi:acetoin utilization protein AcuC
MAGKVAVVHHPEILRLDFGEGHPLRGDRYQNFLALFSKLGLDKSPDFEVVGCEPATDEDLLLVHTKEYIDEVNSIAKQNGYLSVDTPINDAIVKGTYLAVGGALEAGRRVAEGVNHHAVCFGGFHHAGVDYGAGFCVYNDVAILARALVRRHHKKRVMIIDTDAHAGDGTQEILAADKEILMVTHHQDPKTIFPGRGFPHEIGTGDAKGHTMNIPMPLNSSIDDFERVFRELIIPVAREFKPEILIRNGGSDPHYADELTQLGLSVADFKKLGSLVREAAGDTPIVDMYGSGYNPIVLSACWMSLLSGTTGIDIDVPKIREGHRQETHFTPGLAMQGDWELTAAIADVKGNLKPYWKCFQ